MSRSWRWCLVVVLAATVLSGFMPRALLSDSHPAAAITTLSAGGSPAFPSGCTGADCGRSAPVAPMPVLTIAALVAVAAIVVGASAGRATRRMRSLAQALPRGASVILFRPPRYSSPPRAA